MTLISKLKFKLRPDAVDPAEATGGTATDTDWFG